MLIAFYIFADKFSLSVVLGTVLGSAASIGNYILNIYTVKYSAKYDPKKAGHIVLFSKVIRAFLMGIIVYFILIIPLLHNIAGIIALFFPQISRGIIYLVKS